MELSAQSIPVDVGPRHRYDPLVNAIVAGQGAWVSIDPAKVGGQCKTAKQSLLLQAGKLRGLRFETTFRCSPLFLARLLDQDGRPIAQPTSALLTVEVSQ